MQSGPKYGVPGGAHGKVKHEFKHTQSATSSAAAFAPTSAEVKLNAQLATYFQSESGDPDFVPEVAPAPYYYKKGTPHQVQLGLRKPPKTAQEFYDLAITLYNGQLTDREDSYFFSQLQFAAVSTEEMKLQDEQDRAMQLLLTVSDKNYVVPGPGGGDKETIKKAIKRDLLLPIAAQEAKLNAGKEEAFIVNLLADAAQVGHPASLVFLAELSMNPDFKAQLPAIHRALNSQGYRHVANKDGMVELEFWARKVPASTAEMESFAGELETQGRVGTDYILSHPSLDAPRELAQRVRDQVRQMREVDTQMAALAQHAKKGELEQAVELSKTLLINGKKVFLKQYETLVGYTNQKISEASDNWFVNKTNELAHLAKREDATQETVVAFAEALLTTGEKIFTKDSARYKQLLDETKGLVDFAQLEFERRQSNKLNVSGPHSHPIKEPSLLGKPVVISLPGNFNTLHSAVRKRSEDQAQSATLTREMVTSQTDPMQLRYPGVKIGGKSSHH